MLSLALHAERDGAIHESVERVILTQANVYAGMNTRAALADDDATGANRFAAVHLDAKSLRFGIAAVT